MKFILDGAMFLALTGANMGGKSTYLRCCALSILLAQMGSFVPCESARFSLIDGIHTRYIFILLLDVLKIFFRSFGISRCFINDGMTVVLRNQ